MNVKTLSDTIPTPRNNYNQSLEGSAKIVPVHKKSVSLLGRFDLNLPQFVDNKPYTALTQRKVADAYYKKKEIFDIGFNLELDKSFKENLELKQKRQKIEERKRKEEEFIALKEAKLKLLREKSLRDSDDLNREQEKIRKKHDILIEQKKSDTLFNLIKFWLIGC